MAFSRSGPGEEKVFTTRDNPAYVSHMRDTQDSHVYEIPTLQPPPEQEAVYETVVGN